LWAGVAVEDDVLAFMVIVESKGWNYFWSVSSLLISRFNIPTLEHAGCLKVVDVKTATSV
jgi:hypothetical protein